MLKLRPLKAGERVTIKRANCECQICQDIESGAYNARIVTKIGTSQYKIAYPKDGRILHGNYDRKNIRALQND